MMRIATLKQLALIAMGFVAIFAVFFSLPDSRTYEASKEKQTTNRNRLEAPTHIHQADENNRKIFSLEKLPKSHFIENVIESRKTSEFRPPFDLLLPDGNINPTAATALRLTDTESEFTKKLTAELLQRISDLVQQSTSEISGSSIPYEQVYRIIPFSDESELEFERYLHTMAKTLGDDRAWLLARALPVEQIAAGFGTNEVIYRIRPSDTINLELLTPEQVKATNMVEIEYRDPLSGLRTGSSFSDYEIANSTFLNALK